MGFSKQKYWSGLLFPVSLAVIKKKKKKRKERKKEKKLTSVAKDTEEGKPLNIFYGGIQWYNSYGKRYGISSKN